MPGQEIIIIFSIIFKPHWNGIKNKSTRFAPAALTINPKEFITNASLILFEKNGKFEKD